MPWEKAFDKEKVLEAAMTAFRAKGYASTSMQDLLDVMGIQRGSFYDTFHSKREIYVSALDLYRKKVGQWLESLQAQHQPKDVILAFFDSLASEALSTPKHDDCCLVVLTAIEHGPYDKEMADMAAEGLATVEQFFLKNLLAAKAAGTVSEQLDAPTSAQALVGMLTGLRVMCRMPAGIGYVQAINEQVKKMLA